MAANTGKVMQPRRISGNTCSSSTGFRCGSIGRSRKETENKPVDPWVVVQREGVVAPDEDSPLIAV